MRLLVTGAGGLLGGRLALILARRHGVVAGVHRAPAPEGLASVPLDLEHAESIDAALDAAAPQAVVHSAALADADRCEADPELARELNLRATQRLARLCAVRRIRLVALSTALVHGRGHGPRRTASESILQGLRAGRRLQLFTDQYRTPVDPESVADAVDRVLERRARGLFHAGGPERLSRYELGLRVAALFGLPAELLEPVTESALRLHAPRPADVSLDSSRARRELGWAPRPLDEGLRESRADGD